MINVSISVTSDTLGSITVDTRSYEHMGPEANKLSLVEALDEARLRVDRALELGE